MMSGDGTLGYCHYPSHRCNNGNENSEKKGLEVLWVGKFMDIGILRPATIPQVIVEVVDMGLLRPSTLPLVIT